MNIQENLNSLINANILHSLCMQVEIYLWESTFSILMELVPLKDTK